MRWQIARLISRQMVCLSSKEENHFVCCWSFCTRIPLRQKRCQSSKRGHKLTYITSTVSNSGYRHNFRLLTEDGNTQGRDPFHHNRNTRLCTIFHALWLQSDSILRVALFPLAHRWPPNIWARPVAMALNLARVLHSLRFRFALYRCIQLGKYCVGTHAIHGCPTHHGQNERYLPILPKQ
jgi:hypothetical protein